MKDETKSQQHVAYSHSSRSSRASRFLPFVRFVSFVDQNPIPNPHQPIPNMV